MAAQRCAAHAFSAFIRPSLSCTGATSSPATWRTTAAFSTSRSPCSGQAQAPDSAALPSMQPGAAQAPSEQQGEAAAPSSSGGSGSEVVYTGPFSKPHKRLKWASLLNTAASLSATPLLVMYADASPLIRVGMGASLAFFGVFTTAALHWFTSPYVHELRYDKSSGQVGVTNINLLGQERQRSFHINDVALPSGLRPLATFKAGGRSYYIDKHSFKDTELLQQLSPEDPELIELQRMADAARGTHKD